MHVEASSLSGSVAFCVFSLFLCFCCAELATFGADFLVHVETRGLQQMLEQHRGPCLVWRWCGSEIRLMKSPAVQVGPFLDVIGKPFYVVEIYYRS